MNPAARRPRPAGMTLTELLVVMAIIMLISAATLPTIITSLNERDVSEAASIVQANFSLTRDRATGTGQPAGIRLLPDPGSSQIGGILASNRMVPLSQAPDYSEGYVIPVIEIARYPSSGIQIKRLAVYEAKTDASGLLAPPVSWYYNIRQGDTLRLEGSSISYSIAGPMTIGPAYGNPERFVNRTQDDTQTGTPTSSLPLPSYENHIERLYLLNGRDDPPSSGNGYIDEAFDGIDNNGDLQRINNIIYFVDPGFNGVDDDNNGVVDEPLEMILVNGATGPASNLALAEYEIENEILGSFEFVHFTDEILNGVPLVRRSSNLAAPAISIFDTRVPRYRYIISRRPMVAPGAREINLPAGAVIDLTTTAFPFLGTGISERSRVPIDPFSGYVDLMVATNGQVYPSTPFGATSILSDEFPFFYLWIAERQDLAEPSPPTGPGALPTRLPVTRDAALAGGANYPKVIEGDRRLVVISPKTGHASVNEVSQFDTTNVNAPYVESIRFQQTGE